MLGKVMRRMGAPLLRMLEILRKGNHTASLAGVLKTGESFRVSWLRIAQLVDRPVCLYLAFLFYSSLFAVWQNAHNSKPEYVSLETLNSEDRIPSRVPGKRSCPLGKSAVLACWSIRGCKPWHGGLTAALQHCCNKKTGLCQYSKGQEKLAWSNHVMYCVVSTAVMCRNLYPGRANPTHCSECSPYLLLNK